ncbi:TonB-dependent receptor plug domain-containing protein [Chryseobacterium lathyri]|uniref:TonB-dependent SusC/RagA subfamily outer membrane receptor n=1 Tax=Chryseobacterium lathyri TaxID=395933 RepID=A0ABT9SSH3_9FLAO|nr:TonB-dependent receptor plug domain-containing protein [Chryseobacterium lathyri]MDP9961751.1 TonB-dependent SusC/RagA subfamily outer membrane receptor [Chryseobacterium lathyri]
MKITIPKLCHENWETMTPEEKGRFCSVCSKTVRDFTIASDEEIINVFSHSSENICGNFYESQLNRNLQYSYLNSVFVKFAVGFILTTGGLVSVNAQQSTANDTLKTEEIKEVVLQGLGKQKDQKMLGAITVIPADTLIKAKENVTKEIPPKVPGLIINQMPENSSGRQGIRIGGANASLRNDQKPLVVMNNKIASLEDLQAVDPNTIKTMNILKGSSAVAIYGSQAQNGVIVVTTKSKRIKK